MIRTPRPLRSPRTLVVKVIAKNGTFRGAVWLAEAILGVTEDGPGCCIITLRTGRDVRVALDAAEVLARLGWPGAVALESL